MLSRVARLALALGALALGGCTPSIGDKCALSTDCAANGTRLCDTTQPGGYCTVYNCVGDDCPTESICVLFPAAAPGCDPDDRRFPPRNGRSLCLLACTSDTECRAGYVCADPASAPYGARTLADNRAKVCLVAASGLEQATGLGDAAAPVCSPNGSGVDASIPVADGGAGPAPDAGADAEPAADASVD